MGSEKIVVRIVVVVIIFIELQPQGKEPSYEKGKDCC